MEGGKEGRKRRSTGEGAGEEKEKRKGWGKDDSENKGWRAYEKR